MVIMMTLFDEEQISKNYEASIRREEREKATKIATQKANENFVLNMYKDGCDIEYIARMVALSADEVKSIIEKNNNLALV